MRWLSLTVALLTASVCLLGWVYLRDRDPSGWRPPEQSLARVDAARTLTMLGGPACHSACAAALLGRTQPHRWLVRVTVRGHQTCMQIDVSAFAVSREHGLVGVRPAGCVRS
jgi:hypothetical protein